MDKIVFKDLITILEKMECFVCLQKCVIPLQLQCYDCFSTHEMNCNSTKRICVQCITKTKLETCSFCRSKKVNNNIVVDFQGIHNDVFSILSCPFCIEFKGSHFDLYKHLKGKCLNFCSCGDLFLRKEEKKHYETCKEKTWCSKCKEFVKKCHHQHCSICSSSEHSDIICKNRTLQCTICKEEKKIFQIIEHYMEHLEKSKNKVAVFKQEYLEEKKKYQAMMLFLPELYMDFYNEEF